MRHRYTIGAAFLMSLGVSIGMLTSLWHPANAEQPAQTRPDKKPSAEELRRMPFEKALEISLGRKPRSDIVNLTVELRLNALLYLDGIPGKVSGEQRARAIKRFQRDVEREQTGVLTLGGYELLNRRYNRWRENHIPLPPYAAVTIVWPNQVFFQGTWVVKGDHRNWRYNYNYFRCYKDVTLCFRSRLERNRPPFRGLPNMLDLDLQRYAVSSWTKTKITATYSDNCFRWTLQIPLSKHETVTETKENARNKDCGKYFKTPPLEKPRVSILRMGFSSSRSHYAKRSDKAVEYLNKDVRAAIQKLRKATTW